MKVKQMDANIYSFTAENVNEQIALEKFAAGNVPSETHIELDTEDNINETAEGFGKWMLKEVQESRLDEHAARIAQSTFQLFLNTRYDNSHQERLTQIKEKP